MQNIINLPKPFNPPSGEYFYYVTPYGVVRDIKPASYKSEMYGCFRTEEEAFEWMKVFDEMRRAGEVAGLLGMTND